MNTVLIERSTRSLGVDEQLDVVIWKVPVDEAHQHGLKYSLNYRVWNGNEWIPFIRFDNAHGIGDHVHILDEIKSIEFQSIGDLYTSLFQLIDQLRGEINEIKESGNLDNG